MSASQAEYAGPIPVRRSFFISADKKRKAVGFPLLLFMGWLLRAFPGLISDDVTLGKRQTERQYAGIIDISKERYKIRQDIGRQNNIGNADQQRKYRCHRKYFVLFAKNASEHAVGPGHCIDRIDLFGRCRCCSRCYGFLLRKINDFVFFHFIHGSDHLLALPILYTQVLRNIHKKDSYS